MNNSNLPDLPFIAIIRGVNPDNCIDVAKVLIDKGFTNIEVPLNSPDALISIQMLVDNFSTQYLKIGAGTVTNIAMAEKVMATGANLLVTPNCDEQVIKLGVMSGCDVYPGVVTPTEAFKAVQAGATNLKLFPISMVGIDGMKAMLSVLPKTVKLYPVGGINPTVQSMQPYMQAGASGFGLGSSLYRPDMSLATIARNAEQFVTSFTKIA